MGKTGEFTGVIRERLDSGKKEEMKLKIGSEECCRMMYYHRLKDNDIKKK